MHSGLGIAPGRGPAGASDAGRAPLQLSRLIGREQELADLERSLAAHRLVTLTGTGGTGKTRLAAELALRFDVRGDISVAWVELAACHERGFVVQQTAAVLSVRETSAEGTIGALIEALRERKLLLILDNCEHLIDSCAEFASTLLANCPSLLIVATSREPLGIAGERLMPIRPLSLAQPGATDPALVGRTDAVTLFVDRAVAVAPAFELNASNAAIIAAICRRLDGIPLAIELAAARVRHLTPEQIAARLEDSFAILSGGSRTALAHHRTIRATIDWSFALLSCREQDLFARLSVFSGSFALEAVESVCTSDDIPPEDVLDILGSLVDKSLVTTSLCGSGARYQLLETIRQYAAEKLYDSEIYKRRHALAFLDLARASADELQTASSARLASLDLESDNYRTALIWSLEHEPDSIALPLAASYRFYWYYRILWNDGMRWMERVLEKTSDRLSPDRAAAVAAAGAFAAYLGDVPRARDLLERAESMWRELRDERQLAFTLSALAQLLGTSGDLENAARRAEESVALARRSGVPYDIAYCLTNALAFIAQLHGELDRADAYLDEAQRIWTDHPIALPFALNARALLAIRRGDRAAAASCARRALAVARQYGDLWFSSRSLRILAFTAEDAGRAARLLGAADAMLRAMAAGILLHERDLRNRLLERLRGSLSADELENAMLEGSSMTVDEACACALADGNAPLRAVASESSLSIRDLGPLQIFLNNDRLSTEGRAAGRARELLALLAAHPDGQSREEIGAALWPDASGDQVKNSFHVTLHRLRRVLDNPDVVRLENGRYSLNSAIASAVDSRTFERDVTAALRREGGDEAAPVQLQKALSLYRGDYLQGEDVGEWCLPIRAHLRRIYLRALFAVGEADARRGRYAEAAETFTLLLSRDPYDEAASRQLMICRARLGARSESLLIYRQLEQRLRDELSSAPEPETATLYRRLRQNESV